jgi:hypothetical protein
MLAPIDSAVATSQASFSPNRRAARRCSRAPRLGEVKALNGETLKRGERPRLVGGSFQLAGPDDRRLPAHSLCAIVPA